MTKKGVMIVQNVVTAKQLSKELSISKWLVYELTKQNKLPHIKLGKSIRYDLKIVFDFLNKNKV